MNAKTKNVLYGVIPRIGAVGMIGYKYGIYEAVIALLVIMAITNHIGFKLEEKA